MAAYWILEVTYPLGDDFVLDDKLRAIVGKEASGSGAGFGGRDIDWTFDNGPEADTVATKLRAYAVEHDLGMAVVVTMHQDEE
jgi:hypothetical protein